MVDIPKYKTIADYTNVSDVDKLMNAVKDSTPYFNPFFIILFGVFLALAISSYYSQIKLVGNQRFFNSVLASAFGTFIVSILFSLMELITPFHVMMFIAISLIGLALASFYR